MGRFNGSLRTGAGSTTLPIASLYSPAGSGGKLKEVHIFNTTAVAVALMLARLDTAGTKPAATTDGEYDEGAPPALMQFHGTHTVAPTLGEVFPRVVLGASIGSGIIWTFGDNGIVIPLGTANGVGVIVAVGTGQICDVTMVWDE